MRKLLFLLLPLLLIGCATPDEIRRSQARSQLERQEIEVMWQIYEHPSVRMIKIVDTGECFLITFNGGITSAYCTNPVE